MHNDILPFSFFQVYFNNKKGSENPKKKALQ